MNTCFFPLSKNIKSAVKTRYKRSPTNNVGEILLGMNRWRELIVRKSRRRIPTDSAYPGKRIDLVKLNPVIIIPETIAFRRGG